MSLAEVCWVSPEAYLAAQSLNPQASPEEGYPPAELPDPEPSTESHQVSAQEA